MKTQLFCLLGSYFTSLTLVKSQCVYMTPLLNHRATPCIAEILKEQDRYYCDTDFTIHCLPGWESPENLCRNPQCLNDCGKNASRGECLRPDLCACEIGWTGKDCSTCLTLPGCQHGNCQNPMECNCEDGWSGIYCHIADCPSNCTNGCCYEPNECICNTGWRGSDCNSCIPLPSCSTHGYCEDKPMECKCEKGWSGPFCDCPICKPGCNVNYGYCEQPGECLCMAGWQGEHCTECVKIPGCPSNGYCKFPWQCLGCESNNDNSPCNAPQNTWMLSNATSLINANKRKRCDENYRSQKKQIRLKKAFFKKSNLQELNAEPVMDVKSQENDITKKLIEERNSIYDEQNVKASTLYVTPRKKDFVLLVHSSKGKKYDISQKSQITTMKNILTENTSRQKYQIKEKKKLQMFDSRSLYSTQNKSHKININQNVMIQQASLVIPYNKSINVLSNKDASIHRNDNKEGNQTYLLSIDSNNRNSSTKYSSIRNLTNTEINEILEKIQNLLSSNQTLVRKTEFLKYLSTLFLKNHDFGIGDKELNEYVLIEQINQFISNVSNNESFRQLILQLTNYFDVKANEISNLGSYKKNNSFNSSESFINYILNYWKNSSLIDNFNYSTDTLGNTSYVELNSTAFNRMLPAKFLFNVSTTTSKSKDLTSTTFLNSVEINLAKPKTTLSVNESQDFISNRSLNSPKINLTVNSTQGPETNLSNIITSPNIISFLNTSHFITNSGNFTVNEPEDFISSTLLPEINFTVNSTQRPESILSGTDTPPKINLTVDSTQRPETNLSNTVTSPNIENSLNNSFIVAAMGNLTANKSENSKSTTFVNSIDENMTVDFTPTEITNLSNTVTSPYIESSLNNSEPKDLNSGTFLNSVDVNLIVDSTPNPETNLTNTVTSPFIESSLNNSEPNDLNSSTFLNSVDVNWTVDYTPQSETNLSNTVTSPNIESSLNNSFILAASENLTVNETENSKSTTFINSIEVNLTIDSTSRPNITFSNSTVSELKDSTSATFFQYSTETLEDETNKNLNSIEILKMLPAKFFYNVSTNMNESEDVTSSTLLKLNNTYNIKNDSLLSPNRYNHTLMLTWNNIDNLYNKKANISNFVENSTWTSSDKLNNSEKQETNEYRQIHSYDNNSIIELEKEFISNSLQLQNNSKAKSEKIKSITSLNTTDKQIVVSNYSFYDVSKKEQGLRTSNNSMMEHQKQFLHSEAVVKGSQERKRIRQRKKFQNISSSSTKGNINITSSKSIFHGNNQRVSKNENPNKNESSSFEKHLKMEKSTLKKYKTLNVNEIEREEHLVRNEMNENVDNEEIENIMTSTDQESEKYWEEFSNISTSFENTQKEPTYNKIVYLGRIQCDYPIGKPSSGHWLVNIDDYIACDINSPYYTIDGNCNNIQYPTWGMAFSTYRRLVAPRYDDDIGIATGALKKHLPNPRLISQSLFNEEENDNRHNSFLMTYGQFLIHDITHISRIKENEGFHEHFDIEDSSQEFPFIRSQNVCPSGRREQANLLTPFIDGAMIYGSNFRTTQLLRNMRGGLLKSEADMLPYFKPEFNDTLLLPRDPHNKHYVISGDSRAKTTSMLTSLHTLFKNEHNRIALQIKEVLKEFNINLGDEEDEIIFQETRRIIIAVLQHITYDEYLPSILGPELMKKFQLSSLKNTYYDKDINPTIFNGFTTAFRFGHSQVTSQYRNLSLSSVLLNKTSVTSSRDYADFIIDELQRKCQKVNLGITKDLRESLPAEISDGGFDLGAINIQRSRDHGIGSYNDYRKLIGLRPLTTMTNRPKEITSIKWNKLTKVFRHVEEIDLFTGGLAETPLPGASIGSTFGILIAYQFHLLKYGDRRFYSHVGHGKSNQIATNTDKEFIASLLKAKYVGTYSRHKKPKHYINEGKMKDFRNTYEFTYDEIDKIRHRSLGGILCDNIKEIESVGRKIFNIESRWNPSVSCKSFEPFDVRTFICTSNIHLLK